MQSEITYNQFFIYFYQFPLKSEINLKLIHIFYYFFHYVNVYLSKTGKWSLNRVSLPIRVTNRFDNDGTMVHVVVKSILSSGLMKFSSFLIILHNEETKN